MLNNISKHILVVDDDPDILDALRLLLESEGYSVTTSEKGEYVEHLCQDNGYIPDLIVLDVLLSGKDGRTICKKLKHHLETQHIPVIMISAHPSAAHSMKEIGANAFVAKPFAIDHLLETINQQLS